MERKKEEEAHDADKVVVNTVRDNVRLVRLSITGLAAKLVSRFRKRVTL